VIIDTHVHLIRPFDSHGNPQCYSPHKPTGAEDYLAVMEDAGIDRAFFISWSPEDLPADLEGKGIAFESVRETMARDYALEVMARFPDRFYWFPCHLGPQVPNHMALARESLELGAAGLKLAVSFWGELPDDPRPMRICELAREFDAQIILDTSFWYLGKDRPADPDSLPQGFREVAKRVQDFPDYLSHLRAVIAAYPTINFQLAHAGACDWTVERAREVGRFMREHPNVYADLGAVPLTAPGLECLVEAAGEDRIMFGTDWPHFAQGPKMREALDSIRRPGRFAARVAEKIVGENAVAFVKGREPGLKQA